MFSQTFDVLTVEKPQHLIIYDSFQQSLGVTQAQMLQPFAPLKILKLHDLLSDGITACMKVELEGRTLFLLNDENDKLAGLAHLGEAKTFRNKVFHGDTVEILLSAQLIFREPDKKRANRLEAGDLCVRYFDEDGTVYVKKLGVHATYGWTSLPLRQEGKWWRVVRSRRTQNGLSAVIVERLTQRVKEANEALSQIYSQLASETRKKLPAPQWSLKTKGESITFMLQPPSSAHSYRKSIAALTETLQTYLLGSGFDASPVENRIEVKRR
ncbi:MAG TPA: hypothetical protein VI704_00280 [Bacteroidota bacterium]|nr:hypothetical protein [Bacteroidota bacterium]